MSVSPIDRVLGELDRVAQRGDHWEARCPAHADKVASLSITLGAEDRVLLKCHAGCSVGEVLSALELDWKDLHVEALGKTAWDPEPAKREIVATYDYTDEAGALLYQVVRYSPKGFAQRRPGTGGETWTWRLGDVRQVPYRLPELIQAVADERWIFVVEGEKDVETLRDLGFAATTSAGGAQSWEPAMAKHFAGARVAIVPDNDPPGRDYGKSVATALDGVAADVRVVQLPTPPKGDATDWVVAGGTAESLKQLVVAAAGSTRRDLLKQWREANGGARVTCLADVEPASVAWFWPGRVPFGQLTVMDGNPGQGKSTLTLALAALASTGTPLPFGGLGGRQEALTTILLSAEDGLGDTIAPRLLAQGADLTRIHSLDSVCLPDAPERPWSLPEDITHLGELVEELGARLVILDPLMAFLSGTVKSGIDHDVRRAIHPLSQLAQRTGAAVIVVRHLRKGGGGLAMHQGGGSIGIIGAARSGLVVACDPNDETMSRRVVAVSKLNVGLPGEALAFHLEPVEEYDCARVVFDGVSPHTAETLLAALPPDETEEVGRCAEALKRMLVDDEMPVSDILRRVRSLGISDKTLARARKMLGLSEMITGEGAWWGLPNGK